MPIVNQIDQKRLFGLDEIFLTVEQKYGPPPNWQRPPNFESLVRTIIEQQVSLESGKAVFRRLSDYIGEINPKKILKLTDDELQQCALSRQKIRYLRELSKAVDEKLLRIEQLSKCPSEICRQQLLSITGIGNWTADIFQMICLQEKDIFPVGDVAIINAVQKLTGLKDREEILERSQKWSPLRSLASFYLWHHRLSETGRTVEY